MKIRFYHRWIYQLYYLTWTPIFKARPDILRAVIAYAQGWLEQEEKRILARRKQNIKIIK